MIRVSVFIKTILKLTFSDLIIMMKNGFSYPWIQSNGWLLFLQ